ncbi:hypothetical protein A2U01_0063335, partial [Trifolium medium]|nr:hypothetical protein [Trifolium medium]
NKLSHPLDQGLLAQRAFQRAGKASVAFSRFSRAFSEVPVFPVAFCRCSEETSEPLSLVFAQRPC